MKISVPSLAAFFLLAAGHNLSAATVELNGISCLFGDRTAFLVLSPPAAPDPVSFSLSEGQSRFGVKLLAVDAAQRRVQIEQGGVTEYLSLCATPTVAWRPEVSSQNFSPTTAGDSTASPEQLQVDQFLNDNEDVQHIRDGNPAGNFAYFGAAYPSASAAGSATANSPGSSSSGAASPDLNPSGSAGNNSSDSSAAAGGASDATAPASKPYWYVQSLNVERNRLATADEVIAGDMEPLPRTPLTPAATPAILVGQETVFANHLADFLVADSSTY